MILGAESASLSKLYWPVKMENENDSGRKIILIILVVGIQKFASQVGGVGLVIIKLKANLSSTGTGLANWN